ncbi:MAG: class I mannose-6-phosphate isomerase [Bacteroidales bacterium]|nr:class I mannose-6-phosphate isomerase [Bacteroidales bacterium]
MKKLYPLKFIPTLKNKVWGGESLIAKYNKQLRAEEHESPTGEVWEIFDLAGESSMIENGFLAENDLADLLETYMGELVGDNIFDFFQLQFPLTVKLLEAHGNLSVQVHPDDETAFERYYSYGKQEFLYVVDADPSARVYMGFKEKVTVEQFYKACQDGTLPLLMNEYVPKKGDSFLITPGTVHSAGGGLLLVEVSQPSDVVMRLYDWHRDDKERELLVEEAIDCIDYNKYDAKAFRNGPVDTDRFSVNKIDLSSPVEVNMDKFNGFVVYTSVGGRVDIDVDGTFYVLNSLESILIPASLDTFTLIPVGGKAELLEISVREQKEPEDSYVK